MLEKKEFFLKAGNLGAKHGFSLRTGSEVAFFQEAGFSRLPVTIKQIHGNEVVRVDHEAEFLEGDALITNKAGIPVAVMTADCVPILLNDPVRGAIAAIHAGWRGTEKKIVQATIARMGLEYGTLPKDLFAAIGPAIGPCCYEVGSEVFSELSKLPGAEDCLSERSGKTYADLKKLNSHQLKEAGVTEISISDSCTRCEKELFFSYRRDGAHAGRMISAIEI
ncbi:MAG TPA: peptidoglycan editing factor PgeF [Cyanobacteria bacterium UBA8530]|nr:peptidoglycan editing factor PgeF [Cyanobacteria bacterium UBA8530]